MANTDAILKLIRENASEEEIIAAIVSYGDDRIEDFENAKEIAESDPFYDYEK